MISDKIEISEKAVSAIASSAERYIGYIYAGILPILILAIENGPRVKQLTESLGGVLTAISTFVLGIGIFTIYFRVLGDLILFPLQHGLHYLIDLIIARLSAKRTSPVCTSPVWLLLGYGVSFVHIRAAYQAVRSRFFENQSQVEIQVSHGELHVLYLTSVCLFAAYCLMAYLDQMPSPYYLYIGGVVYVAALVCDTRQHAAEAALFRAKAKEIQSFLVSKGLLERMPTETTTVP